jgi:hypothetical protein
MGDSTVIQTVLSGVAIFVVGQLVVKLVIDPVFQLKKTMAEIAHTFICFAHALHNPDIIPRELHHEVYDKLRQLSGQLYADMRLIPIYVFWGRVFFLPSATKVYKSAQNLIAVGNWMSASSTNKFEHITRNIQNACDNLGLYIAPEDRIDDELIKKVGF